MFMAGLNIVNVSSPKIVLTEYKAFNTDLKRSCLET